ncbi:unnamed protein product [Didymodactylos carnosus]|uniref:Guanine nucleotide-binding protein subunit gamma n=1 Tax=Didymodactylos carnosus TaxID=1234261 RepID=A0A813TCE5_9BILA|nr:unnamed protein product [Didymodactylos carnosus]CAF1197181.1 unnamed protein product [Didymodactylos carnosus]CAF3593279.1 unnamed protein product [Didymodactylos carnosus]CAF4007427.1 unnamed protein product [Didymodactylos carnosus]
MSSVSTKKKLVEQLRQEASIDRQKVSTVCKDIIKFCQDHESADVLVRGWSNQKENPFKEKAGCLIL